MNNYKNNLNSLYPIHFFIPLVPCGGSGRKRTTWIKRAEEFIPFFGERFSPEMSSWKFHVDVTMYYRGKYSKDIDNSLKGIFDAIKKRVIPDDIQIMSVNAIKMTEAERTGIEVWVMKK